MDCHIIPNFSFNLSFSTDALRSWMYMSAYQYVSDNFLIPTAKNMLFFFFRSTVFYSFYKWIAKLYQVFLSSFLSLDVTSWRDGGGRALAPTLTGEGAAEGGNGGALVMDGAAGVPPQNSQSHGPPRNPPAGSPALPLPQPPVGPGFPPYRGIMPPFVSFPSHLLSGKHCRTGFNISF